MEHFQLNTKPSFIFSYFDCETILCLLFLFFFFTAALLTDPVVVTELIKEEELKVKHLVEKFSEKMKKLHVSRQLLIYVPHFLLVSKVMISI